MAGVEEEVMDRHGELGRVGAGDDQESGPTEAGGSKKPRTMAGLSLDWNVAQ